MAKDGLTELALMLKEMENPAQVSITTGTVISLSPPQIRLNDVIVLYSDDLTFAESISTSLLPGDEVILMPTSDGQLFFVLDKAVTL